MQRPVMNPTFTYDEAPKAPPKQKFARTKRLLRFAVRILLSTPFGHGPQFRAEEGTRFGRFVKTLTYRIAFVPVLLVGFLVALVFATTHPGRVPDTADPLSTGVYYDPVYMASDDGARIDGWLVPVLDARRVLEGKDDAVNKRYPAVVLVHDFACSRQQLLPMVQPLHQAGFVVLAINLRGAASGSRAAQTFGIKEAMDVKAAVEMLRRRAYVDASKIGVVGIGTGGNAALIATRNDPALLATVVAAPINGFDEAMTNRVGADRRWLPPLRPLVRWTFQLMNGVDAADLDLANFAALTESGRIMLTTSRVGLMETGSMRSVAKFLQKNLSREMASAK